MRRALPLLICLLFLLPVHAQRVGVVLSGGGASGMAHIGVLKALEENKIPIDYITGTSFGALVGSLYASGWSPTEIEAFFSSAEFERLAKGIIKDDHTFYFHQRDPVPSWVTFNFSPSSILETGLPTNLTSPVPLELALMEIFAGPEATSQYNFDSLLIPFRCVASDVVSKKPYIFSRGHLSQAVRASIAYPFYLNPVILDDKVLYDGGLYNNFPSDVMYDHFFPDIIIGSNVSGNAPPPDEDNLLSQLRSMLVTISNYNTSCENGIMIEPATDVSVFDFSDPAPTIQQGYQEALKMMPQILERVSERSSLDSLDERRQNFKKSFKPISFSSIKVQGLNRQQTTYVQKIVARKKKQPLSLSRFIPRYYRLVNDEQIKSAYPLATYNDSLYDLTLRVKKERELSVSFGGNISNKRINQGFFAAQYNYLTTAAVSFYGNIHFGRLYTSGLSQIRIEFPTRVPIYLEGTLLYNQLDFFRSRQSLFNEDRGAYLVKKEQFFNPTAGISLGKKGKLVLGYSYGSLKNEYYQTTLFARADTADQTIFRFVSGSTTLERNSLNRKMYASAGNRFAVKFRYLQGEEFTRPGSTSREEEPFRGLHEWWQVKGLYDIYLNRSSPFKIGFYGEAVFSTQPAFDNYTATILTAPAFSPTPESQTLFLEQFRATKFLAAGVKGIITVKKVVDLRAEGYVFQPHQVISRSTPSYAAEFGEPFAKRFFLASATLVYHSPLAPVSLSANYYPGTRNPFSILFHLGYIIYNRRALD